MTSLRLRLAAAPAAIFLLYATVYGCGDDKPPPAHSGAGPTTSVSMGGNGGEGANDTNNGGNGANSTLSGGNGGDGGDGGMAGAAGAGGAGSFVVWNKHSNGISDELPAEIAVGPNGHPTIAGIMTGGLEFGSTNPALASAGIEDVFVVQLDGNDGTRRWAHNFGDSVSQEGVSVAVDSNNNVIIAGNFKSQTGMTIGADNLLAEGQDIFVAKFDPSGNPLWAHSYGGVADQTLTDMAIDTSVAGANDIVLVGRFANPMANPLVFGADSLITYDTVDVFVLKMDTAGTPEWAVSYGNEDDQRVNAVAIAANGRIALTGEFSGSMVVSNGVSAGLGEFDVFVAQLESDGTPASDPAVVDFGVGDTEDQTGLDIAYDSTNRIIAVGSFEGEVNFSAMYSFTTPNPRDGFLVILSPTLTTIYGAAFGGMSDQIVEGVAIDGSDNILITGSFQDSINFGGIVETSAGDTDVFLSKLDSGGLFTWSIDYGDADANAGTSVAVDASDNILLTGEFDTVMDFDNGMPMTAGLSGVDAFAVKFTPGPPPP